VKESLLHAFVTLFVVIDPIGQIPTFVGLTRSHSNEERRRTAVRGVLIAAVVLFAFAFIGDWLLRALGISMAALKIAGGALLFLLAMDMVFALETGIRTATGEEKKEAQQRHDISVFPLAIPLIAGPGAFTSLALLMGRYRGDTGMVAAVLAVLAFVLLLSLLSLLLATRMQKVLGITGANVIGRVLGILLAALAVQFVLDGVREAGLFG
jgi:multiple antibiotic resistance protein